MQLITFVHGSSILFSVPLSNDMQFIGTTEDLSVEKLFPRKK